MMNRFGWTSLGLLLLTGCGSATRPLADGARAELFAPGVISTGDQFSATFTPDGRTVYTVRSSPDRRKLAILQSSFTDGRWTPPVVAPFSGVYRDIDPFVTPDGRTLVFNSTRPGPGEPARPDTGRRPFDIWTMARQGNGWGEPRPLGPPVNTPTGSEFYATMSADRTLYYAVSSRPGLRGRNDLYRSRWANGGYEAPEPLSVNSDSADANPYIAPDGSYLLFFSDRAGGFGDVDLYIAYRDGDGWTEPQNLGPQVNTDAGEFCPMVSPDGRWLYFSRVRFKEGLRVGGEHIYRIPWRVPRRR